MAGVDAGARCVAIEHDGHPASVQDVPVDERNLVNQGSLLSPTRGGPAVIYGFFHPGARGPHRRQLAEDLAGPGRQE